MGGRSLAGEGEQVILYQCVRCGTIVKSTDLELGVRCPYCRYRVLRKVRPPVVKRVPAR
ncbi:MAG: DNA-directed RNA polymerase subunit P [Candidatus Bathyarchaeia archaeon]